MPKGPNGQKRPADAIGLAVMIGKIATGEIEDERETPIDVTEGKRRGGLARSRNLTQQERTKIAKIGAKSRWGKVRPERESAE